MKKLDVKKIQKIFEEEFGVESPELKTARRLKELDITSFDICGRKWDEYLNMVQRVNVVNVLRDLERV